MPNQGSRNRYREKLLQLMDRLDGERTELVAVALQPGGETPGVRSTAPMHPEDLWAHHAEEDVELRLVENEEATLREIHAALERLESGTFGVCEDCHRPIGRERLAVLPYTRHCVRCAARQQASPAAR